MSQLVTKTTSFTKEDIRTEENFDIALDFALYNLDHHSFLDCDPHETDGLYNTLQRRLELNSCLQKRRDLCEGRKRLRRAFENERVLKNKDDDDDLVQLVRDPCHRILSLLYWLSGNPVNPAETPSSTLQETPTTTTTKKVEEDRHAEAPTGQEGKDEWTVSDEIALCDSASELSDWSEDDLGGELVDEGEIAAERAPSGGTGAGPLGSPAVLVEVEEGRPGRGGPAPLAGVRAAAEASERHAIRRHLLLLRGDGLAGAAAAQDTGSSHPSGLGGNVARAAVALADAVGSLRLAPRDGLPPCSTLSAFHASVDRQLSRHSSWCRSLEERSLRGRGGELTMIELAGEIEAQAASVSHLTAAREEVEEATRTATSTCECAALVLTALWRLWRRSSLDVSPRVGEGGFDPARLARDLFTSSSRPYLRMLEEYLNEGRVRDPRGEFFISSASSSAESGQEGAYWRQGHRVRGPAPSFLAAEAESILLSGKALGVLGARGVPGPELRIPLLGNEDRPGPAEPMGSAGEAGQAVAGASGRAGGVEKMAAATEAIVEFRWRFRGEEGPESPNSILCALPDDSEPALGSAADLRAALFGGDRGWRRRRPAQGSAAGSQEELGGEGSSDLCPPEEILDSLVLDPVRTRCAAVEHRLLAALRSRHNLVCQLELLKDVYLHASTAEIGGFLKLAFDLTAREGFVDENAELSEAFREANRRGGREGELLSSMVARLDSRGSRTLAISYEATWPLSLLVDETSIAGYNSVFGAVTKALNAQHHLQKGEILVPFLSYPRDRVPGSFFLLNQADSPLPLSDPLFTRMKFGARAGA